MTILLVDHHGGHKVDPIVFILGKNSVNLRACHKEEDRLKRKFKIPSKRLFSAHFLTKNYTFTFASPW